MNKIKRSHRLIATFFMLIFFPTLVPSELYANNNGPVAPEAAIFEPVDATDMVNLATGDLTYVMPLLNIPSPEGGYPISLSYQAGIALEQQSTWTGLGWNLNPGAINRFVNGQPDDWTKSITQEFFFDDGFHGDYYSFSIGGTFSSGLTVGLGATWGTDQAFGGSVSLGYGGIVGSYSTNNGWGVGIGGMMFTSDGMSFTLSGSGDIGGGYSIGVGYNLNNNKLSVGLNYSVKNPENNRMTTYRMASVGISFNSGEISTGTISVGSNHSSSSIGADDYVVDIKDSFIGIDIGVFWFGYGHTSVTYSLFNVKSFEVSGSLYPEDYKIDENYVMLTPPFQNTMSGFYKNDVEELTTGGYSLGTPSSNYYLEQVDEGNKFLRNNYDNYMVASQGLSGQIAPYTCQETFLTTNRYYIPQSFSSSNDLGQNTNFRFVNTNASFLRANNNNFLYNGAIDQQTVINVQNNVRNCNFSDFSRVGNLYSTTITPSGEAIKNGNRMREGNYIETFTNQQINSGTINNFIEAKGVDRLNDEVFSTEQKGIGAYRITTIDGKTYHYSLPVYQFESTFKNFKDQSNENVVFFESSTDRKYATHWLLTAITGPDYFDKNQNGRVDNADYGYWVEFEYGKWSDGYMWRTPNDGYKEMPDINPTKLPSFSYSIGRKQIYYLDIVRTRSHSALFVKNIRQDDAGLQIFAHNSVLNDPLQFNRNNNCVKYVSQRNNVKIGTLGSVFYNGDNSVYTCPKANLDGRKTSYKYFNVPSTHSLSLEKVLLIKNDDLNNLNKSSGNIINSQVGRLYSGYGFTDVKAYNSIVDMESVPDLYSDSGVLKTFGIDMHQNVLDVDDLTGLEIEDKAVNGTSFVYDYSLSRNTPHSPGKLTLKKVINLGRKSSQTTPPFVFEYYNPEITFVKTNYDNWGYNKVEPKAWSLKSIKSPVGAKINIDYESDSFRREAILTPRENNQLAINRIQQFVLGYKPNLLQNVSYSVSNVLKNNDKISLTLYHSSAPAGIRQSIYKGADIYLDYTKNLNSYSDIYAVDSYSYVDDHHTNVILSETEETKYHDEFVSDFYASSETYPFSGAEKLVMINVKVPTDTYTFDPNYGYNLPNSYIGSNNYWGPNGKSGGGLRVKSISVTGDYNETEGKIEYSYVNPHSNKISGITSYEPFDIYKPVPSISMLPVPNVLYEYVTVTRKDNVNQIIDKTQYEFNVIKPVHKIGRSQNSYNQNSIIAFRYGKFLEFIEKRDDNINVSINQNSTVNPNYRINSLNSSFKKRFSALGSLKSSVTFNSKNQILHRKTIKYKENLDDDGQVGVKETSYISAEPYLINSIGVLLKNMSIIEYPNILISTTEEVGNYKNQINYNKHDFLTGSVLETSYTNSKGLALKTKVIPAHKKYNEMGSKIDNINNKNMLSQTAAQYTYTMDSGLWKETGVGITTWNNVWSYKDIEGNSSNPSNEVGVWRKHKTYVWNGVVDPNTGIFSNYNSATDDGFDWSGVGVMPSQWKQMSEITIYDHFSTPVEVKDINGNKASTKMGDNETKITTEGNGGYNEIYYTGAEYIKTANNLDYLDPEIRLDGSASRDDDKAHTGKYSVATTSSGKLLIDMKANQHRGGKYKLSVWVDRPNILNARISVGGVPQEFNGEVYYAHKWALLTHYFDCPTSNIQPYVTSAGTEIVHFDDLMLRPIASSITGYVYNEWDELTHIIGNNGLAIRYEYDEAGRLIKTYVEVVDFADGTPGGFKLKSENKIKYKNL